MHLHAAFLFAKKTGKFFFNNCMEPLKFNISMTTQYKNFKKISAVSLCAMLFLYTSI